MEMNMVAEGCNPKLKNLDGQLPSQIAQNSGHNNALKEPKKAEGRHVMLSAPDAVNPNELWAVTLHDWSCEHKETLRRAFEMADGPVKHVPLETFVSLLQVHQAPVSAENLQNIVKEHDKDQKGVINLDEFFRGRMYPQKTFDISPYNQEKGQTKIKGVKTALQFPISTMPPQSICRKMGSELPDYMIEMYQPFTDTTRFSQRRPPIHPIEDDSVWYIDEPENKYINIHSCVRSGDQESLSLAFIKNVPVDVTDEFSITPLMTACSIGNYQIAKFLIKLGANVKAADQFNQTPLHYACHEGHVDIIRMLVESGATVDSVSTIGETPLMRAIKYCRFSCVEYLIRSGANVMAQNKQEQNCLDIARNYGCGIIIDVISAKYDSLSRIKNNKKVSKPASSKQKKMDIQVPASSVSAVAKQGVKKNINKKVSKPAFSEQKKQLNIQVPPPSVSAAAKQDLIDSIVLKNPKYTMRHASKNDISFVPKTRWGKRLTNTSQHI